MPVRSLNTPVLKWPDKNTVDQDVRSWALEQSLHHPELERCGYFGSYARGDWGVGSDLDLIAVVADTHEPFERRSLNWELNSLPVPADILIYTAVEWKKLQKRNDKFSRMLGNEVVWTYLRNS
jgi:predicted nucleotidyltransferase